MKNTTLNLQSLLAVLLSGTLLFNSAAPALAQVYKPTSPYIQHYEPVQDRFAPVRRQQEIHAQLMYQVAQKARQGLDDRQVSRLLDIREVFLPVSAGEKVQSDFEQFQQLYRKEVDQAYSYRLSELNQEKRQAQKKLDTQAKQERYALMKNFVSSLSSAQPQLHTQARNLLKNTKTSAANQLQQLAQQCDPANEQDAQRITQVTQDEQLISNWHEESTAALQQWYEANLATLNQWKERSLAQTQEIFDNEYNDQLLAEREAFVRQAVADLWNYKKTTMGYNILLEVAPVILPMQTRDGKYFFNQEQKKWLTNQYRQILNTQAKCGTDASSDNPCGLVFTAINGLGMLSDDGQIAQAIVEFMENNYKTGVAVPALISGTAALLAMKQYNKINGLLHKATQDETDIANLDLLSFETLVNAVANRNGQYLGEVSKYGEYPLEKTPNKETPFANVWEDVALLLAQDGSTQALSLLREYGVQRCRVSVEKSVSSKNTYVMRCAGIMPFLVGALISGKSGAQHYHLSDANTHPGYYLNSDGKSGYIDAQTASRNQARLTQMEKNFYGYAAALNMTPAALIARHVFLQTLGDVNAETELRIDNLIYTKAYVPATKAKTPKAAFAIKPYDRNSATYHAKQIAHQRTGVFRTIARVGDIGILVWCLVDITKWATSGVKIGHAMAKAARMARRGATVAERAVMLRKLNIAPKLRKFTSIPANIKTRLAPVVLEQAPQFGMKAVKLPDFTVNTGKVLAEGLAFSRETGELTLLNKKSLLDQGVSPLQIHQTDQALAAVSLKTNTAFANTALTINKNRKYRSLLLAELPQGLKTPALKQADLGELVAQARRLSIKVPENIGSFVKATDVKAKKKITSLMWATGLSLSSASSGLIVPLEQTYGDQITETDKMLITLALPYIPSALCAFITPVVMKIGALRTLQTALGVSSAGLLVAAASGFYGKVNQDNLPPLWPLFVSGTAIGISSALSRSSLNILIDHLGGGANLLKSMMYKNIGAVALLLPPVAFNFLDKDIDFSSAFPVLATLSLGSLAWVSASKFSPAIARAPGFMPFESFTANPLAWPKTLAHNTGSLLSNTWKEGASSFRLLGTKEVLPLVLATTAFTGFESATLNKAGNQMVKPFMADSKAVQAFPDSNRKNVTSLFTTSLIISMPLVARYFSGKLLTAMRSPISASTEYQRMLGASYGLNIGGASLMYANGLSGDNAGWGWLGLGMVGLGTANVTQSFQKLAQFKILQSNYVAGKTAGMTADAVKAYQKVAKDKMMTAFSTSQLGLAIVPFIVGKHTDRQVEEDIITRAEAPRSTLWIPLTSIGLSFALAAPTLRLMPRVFSLPAGTVAATKGIVGSYPTAFKQSASFGKSLWEPKSFSLPFGFEPLPNMLHIPAGNTLQLHGEEASPAPAD